MKHLLTLWMLALCLCVSAKETCPKVIPALQEWKGGSGKLVLPAEGSIVVALSLIHISEPTRPY